MSVYTNFVSPNWVLHFLLILSLAASACAEKPEAIVLPQEFPAQVSLNGDWDFVYMPGIKWADNDRTAPVLPEKGDYVAKMPVPGHWDDNLDRLRWTPTWSGASFNPNYRPTEFPMGIGPPDAASLNLIGIGFYRKVILIPDDWRDRCVTLNIGGARMCAWVWINGNLAGSYAVFNIPFELKIDKLLTPGESNEIVIAAANNHTNRGGCAARGHQGSSAGIYRPVALMVSKSAAIRDLYVYPQSENSQLCWNVEVDGELSGVELQWRILDDVGRSVLGA